MNAFCAYCWPTLIRASHMDASARPCCTPCEGNPQRLNNMPWFLLQDQQHLAVGSLHADAEHEPRWVA